MPLIVRENVLLMMLCSCLTAKWSLLLLVLLSFSVLDLYRMIQVSQNWHHPNAMITFKNNFRLSDCVCDGKPQLKLHMGRNISPSAVFRTKRGHTTYWYQIFSWHTFLHNICYHCSWSVTYIRGLSLQLQQ